MTADVSVTAGRASADRAVCVTGMAWTTALGNELGEVWQKLLSGCSGIRELPADAASTIGRAAGLGGGDFEGGELAAPPARRQVALAATTAGAALRDAGCEPVGIDLFVLGSSLGPHLDDAADTSPNDLTVLVGKELGLGQSPVSLSTACSSGADAILVAAALIRGGVVDRCLCGGIDLLSAAKQLGHSTLGTASPTTIRPFDTRRDGMMLGEGAGFLVLEARSAARDRGARVWGEVRGWGSSNDASGLTAPDTSGAGAVRAVRRAFAKAGVRAEDIAVINAHGTATKVNDDTEATCFAELFGGTGAEPVVFATKPAFGHTLGATGAIEAIALLLSLHHGVAPPLPQCEEIMPGFPLPLPTEGALPLTGATGFSLTLGFGGFNTCLVLERGTHEGRAT
ncbi:beta-ketoacyl-[acyl-carrier-protein] synthase family protein [Streptomyces sp. AM 4-1-1]|uniref:beta-ketoacyl-[acyl-carrier-protein] synthase family protein n=1 Tax=Streptomyces sp. AM 4-1-1 TaxID=3028710 RepID=UPI0023B900F0|nr:beta-ketoacyl-[acyl-carrier-protein] synthase family protein [Streptomyces sp. AM 4-1-1]WEH35107.1 beta-ketoacyl-[acyl-carrier-protein] synthase family protein [Streptomyces sp. AM 4-1-1]